MMSYIFFYIFNIMDHYLVPPPSLLSLNAVHQCSVCNAHFPSIISLRDHMVSELGIEPEFMNFLDLDLGISSSLNTPSTAISTSETVEPQLQFIRCPKCPKLCRGSKGLQQHLAKAHTNRKKSALCTECGKCFNHKHALRFHVRQVHEKSTRIYCPCCGKELYNKYMLKKHQLVCKGTFN